MTKFGQEKIGNSIKFFPDKIQEEMKGLLLQTLLGGVKLGENS